jgi:hypothetical protein
MSRKSEVSLLEEACKNRFLSKWPDSRLVTTRTNSTSSIDFVVELADGGLVILEKKSAKARAGKGRVSMGWSPDQIEPETYQAILRTIKLNRPIVHSTYGTSSIHDAKNKKKLIGFNVSLARTTVELTWKELFPNDPVPEAARWRVVKQSVKEQGRYLVITHRLKDGKSKQINEYKLEIANISKAIYDSTLLFKTFPFNIPHSHKITEDGEITYDRSIDEWEQHAELKGVLENSRVQTKVCSDCDASFLDTSSHLLCYVCSVAEQKVTRKKAIGLCKRAEKLACETDWKQTADSMKQLQLDWQQLGSVPKDDREDLWERFQAATQSFFDARSKWFDQRDKLRVANRKKAKRLIAKAKKIVGSDKWKETGDAVKSLQEDWKAVNPLPKDDAEELWREFRDTTQIFFDRRAAHFESMDAERDENRQKAEGLIDEAGQWSGSDDWKRAGDKLKSLQQQWKTVHPLPRKCAEDLWRTFQDVCQKFFDRRTAHYAAKSGR